MRTGSAPAGGPSRRIERDAGRAPDHRRPGGRHRARGRGRRIAGDRPRAPRTRSSRSWRRCTREGTSSRRSPRSAARSSSATAPARAGGGRPDRRVPERQAADPDLFASASPSRPGTRWRTCEFAYVHDFGNRRGVHRHAARQGAELNGEPLDPEPAASSEARGRRPRVGAAGVDRARSRSSSRARSTGSASIGSDRALALLRRRRLASTAWRPTDTCRSVDAAAAQLIAREAGAFVSVLGYGGVEAPLDLDARYRVVAARTPERLETLVSGADRPRRPSA